MTFKRKIFNDPVYGFITIPDNIVFEIIEHPYFQRLRRIKQTALTHLVYPGALHTRFHHAIGAMHLMTQAINALRMKGKEITDKEAEAATIAILLHDIGHGPYSHTLEKSIIFETSHEDLSEIFMARLNEIFSGKLSLAIEIFNDTYKKKFLHQLISSQLDVDRLDYLKRDSFFTGVYEGIVSTDRIIEMLDVVDDELVVEAKGIYSIEKFIIARRLMFWQVYLHKTVLASEYMLMKALKRAKILCENGENLFTTPIFKLFLKNNFTKNDFLNDKTLLDKFSQLDDYDIFTSLKVWCNHPDIILSELSKSLVYRRLFKIELQNEKFSDEYLQTIKMQTSKKFSIKDDEIEYFVFSDITSNYAYDPHGGKIKILFKDGKILDIAEASDQLNISVLSKPVTKYFICYPKTIKFAF
ncbi:MAG: HD domain-containing protein [Bacteroidales bacterium]|nr:HD domain-containing protein [Bacteroidales bacterium]